MHFPESFDRDVALQPGDTCEWSRHFRGVTREVIGYLDLRVRNRPTDRFTWVSVKHLVAHCKKYGKEKGYGHSAVEYALADLQELFIVCRVRKMKVKGTPYRGFLVDVHDHCCITTGRGCRFLAGSLDGPRFQGLKNPGVELFSVNFDFEYHDPENPGATIRESAMLKRHKDREKAKP